MVWKPDANDGNEKMYGDKSGGEKRTTTTTTTTTHTGEGGQRRDVAVLNIISGIALQSTHSSRDLRNARTLIS